MINSEKHWGFHESCPLKFSPIYILDPKLFVSILTFRVLKYQFFNKICIFSLWQVQNWNITYQLFTKKYTYALIEISPMSKLGWLLRSSWKHELKLPHNSSDTWGDALRTNVKIIKWNESFSRQLLSQSCLFKSLKIKTKKKENITQQNYKFRPLNISINCFNVISFDIYLKRRQNRKL